MGRSKQQRELEKDFQDSLFGVARRNGRGGSRGPIQIEPWKNPLDGVGDSRKEEADEYVVVDEGDVEGVAAVERSHRRA